jgi:hypothetical protein
MVSNIQYSRWFYFSEVNGGLLHSKQKPFYTSKAPDGQGPLLTNYKPKL